MARLSGVVWSRCGREPPGSRRIAGRVIDCARLSGVGAGGRRARPREPGGRAGDGVQRGRCGVGGALGRIHAERRRGAIVDGEGRRGVSGHERGAERRVAVADAGAGDRAGRGRRAGFGRRAVAGRRDEGMAGLREEARRVVLGSIDRDELHRRQRAARVVPHWVDGEGMVAGQFRLPPEVGVPFVEPSRCRDRPGAPRRPQAR